MFSNDKKSLTYWLKQNQQYLPKLVKTLACLQSSNGEERLKSAIILLVHRTRDSFYQGFN